MVLLFRSTDGPAALMEEEMLSEEEQAVHHPPPSLVPRLHCVVARHLAHSNPCIPVELTEVETGWWKLLMLLTGFAVWLIIIVGQCSS